MDSAKVGRCFETQCTS